MVAGAAPVGFGVVLRDRTFMVFVGLTLLGWSMIETNKMLPVALVADGLDVTSYGQVIVVNMVLIVVGQLFLPGVQQQMGDVPARGCGHIAYQFPRRVLSPRPPHSWVL